MAAVEAEVAAGASRGNFSIIDSFVNPNLDESIFPAIGGIRKLEVLGIVELPSGGSRRGRRRGGEDGQHGIDRDPAGDGAGQEGFRDPDTRRGRRAESAESAVEG